MTTMGLRRFARTSLFALALALVQSGAALAVDPVNETLLGVAVKGTDVVAYFTEGRVREGERAHSFEWMDATWRFASAEHRELFAANPEKYAPAYGGYCAYAVSQGVTAPIDPEAWKVVDGRLYLNLDRDIQQIWEQDVPGYIAKADENWPKLLAE
jgi:YHS domain-containing protein